MRRFATRSSTARVGRITPGAIYPTLDRLERKGLFRSYAGDPIPERGGERSGTSLSARAGLAELRRAWGHTRPSPTASSGRCDPGQSAMTPSTTRWIVRLLAWTIASPHRDADRG